MRRLGGWLALSFALLFGALAAFAAHTWLRARVAAEVERAAGQPAKGVAVVALAHDVARAARLTLQDLVLTRLPEGSLPAGAVARLDRGVGRIARTRLYAGEPLLEAKLLPEGSTPGLESQIPPGLRAITVKADEVIGLAGFALPGSRVDVVAVLKPSRSDDPTAKLVVQGVEVLATDQGSDPGDGKPRPASAITLLVSPRDAERLALAVAQGRIQLVLRSPTDEAVADTGGLDALTLLSQQPAPLKPVARSSLRRRERPRRAQAALVAQKESDRQKETSPAVELIENDRRQHVEVQGRAPGRTR